MSFAMSGLNPVDGYFNGLLGREHESGRKTHTLNERGALLGVLKSLETIVAEGSRSRTYPGVSDTPNRI